MPYLVNGQPVPEEVVREEMARISRDKHWQSIADGEERKRRLRAAAEECAQNRILIEQAAANDPRPIDTQALEEETAHQTGPRGCRGAFDRRELRKIAELHLRVQRIRREMVADAVKPTSDEIEAFYTANRDKFPRPELFHASHIVKYVNHEQSEEQAEAGIELAWDELEAGEPFADVATRHSDCKDKGGDLGEFPAGQMVEEFEEEVRALEPGQRSDVFTTPFGFHIAFLHSKKPVGLAAFEEVRPGIERVFMLAREHEAYLHAMAGMRARADIRWAAPEAQAATG